MTETMVFRPVPVMKPRKEADHCTAFGVAAAAGKLGEIHRDKVVNDCHDTGHILSRRRPVYYRYNSDAGFSADFLASLHKNTSETPIYVRETGFLPENPASLYENSSQ